VTAANARLLDLRDGADADDLALQEAQVQAAEIAVARARVEQSQVRLVAPFDGVIAAVNVNAGEYSTPQVPAFVLLTPGALRLKIIVGENDRPHIRAGQEGEITFDALPNEPFGFVIRSVGDAPKIEQGVATYAAEATLTMRPDGARPVSGMSGVGNVLVTEKTDALAIPARALRRIGREQVVDVMVDGAIQERAVVAGISDGQVVEIVSGIEEGERIVLRSVTKSDPDALPTRERVLPGGIR
jgi:RND family efflux transporter MFP subunit